MFDLTKQIPFEVVMTTLGVLIVSTISILVILRIFASKKD